MVDIVKQIAHWRDGAQDDWEVALELVQRGRIRHGLFFAHLALEKTLKAHVCLTKNDLAPPIHNLVRLAEQAALTLEDGQRELLAEVNSFNIEGRYPDLLFPLPSRTEADAVLERIGGLLAWLNRQF